MYARIGDTIQSPGLVYEKLDITILLYMLEICNDNIVTHAFMHICTPLQALNSQTLNSETSSNSFGQFNYHGSHSAGQCCFVHT